MVLICVSHTIQANYGGTQQYPLTIGKKYNALFINDMGNKIYHIMCDDGVKRVFTNRFVWEFFKTLDEIREEKLNKILK